jgi:very-short-patch-repair endonuclease
MSEGGPTRKPSAHPPTPSRKREGEGLVAPPALPLPRAGGDRGVGAPSPQAIRPKKTAKFRLGRPTKRARDLRKEMTPQERLLWSRLRKSQLGGLVFTRQLPVAGHFGDFACRAVRLIVEVDGSQHGEMLAEDAERTRRIEAEGYKVIRFWNNDITANIDGVLQTILAAASSAESGGPPPTPSRKREGRTDGASSAPPHARGRGPGGGPPPSSSENGGGTP